MVHNIIVFYLTKITRLMFKLNPYSMFVATLPTTLPYDKFRSFSPQPQFMTCLKASKACIVFLISSASKAAEGLVRCTLQICVYETNFCAS